MSAAAALILIGRGKAAFAAGVMLLLCLRAGSGMAAGAAPAPLPGADEPVLIGPYLERLIDPGRRLGLEDVRSGAHGARFEPNRDQVTSLGYTDAALWLRFSLPRDSRQEGGLLLEIRFPALDLVELYSPERGADGVTRYRHRRAGDTLPWSARDVKDRNFVFRLTPGEEPYYLRITSESSLLVPAYLWRVDAFAAHARASQTILGVFYGLALALILYNLMLFLSVRDGAYLYYVLYGTAFSGWLLAVDGFISEFGGTHAPWWANNGLAMMLPLSLLFGANFARRFLDIPRISPATDRVLIAMAWVSAALAVCGAAGWLHRGILMSVSVLTILFTALALSVALRALLAGNRTARFFLLAWSVLFAALVIVPVRSFGLLPYNFVTFYGLHVGLALDLLLLSFALGDRFSAMRREAALARSEARAMDIASRHKSEFLANMSHELRTPLNAVIGFSEMLQERYFGDLTAKQAEYVKDIHEAGGHLLSLINDILDLSKVEAGRMELDLTQVNVGATIESALTLVRERAARHGIHVSMDTDASLETIRADERRVKQILLNLLSNAVKFTPDGGRINVGARRNSQAVEISVSDTGVGISPQVQKVVFEEFRQVGKDAARKAEGTGLGLALTKRLVELHGGSIKVESAPSVGTTFTFTLPAGTPSQDLNA